MRHSSYASGSRGQPQKRIPPAAEGSSSLEKKTKSVTREGEGEEEEPGTRLEVISCGCRSWFCERCCKGKGAAKREEVRPVVRTFGGVLLLSLTIDHQGFPGGPREAYDYVCQNNCVSRLIRELKRRGLLYSGRFLKVLEFQKNGFPHWHVLLDADFVDQKVVHEIWNSYGPDGYEGRQHANGYTTRLGFVDLQSTKNFAGPDNATHYVTKYLTKYPEQGYPDWVLDYKRPNGKKGKIRRYERSRDFFAPQDEADTEQADADAREEAGQAEATANNLADLGKKKRAEDRTTREILAGCGKDAKLLLVHEVMLPDGELVERYEYLGAIKDGWDELRREFGIGPDERKYAVPYEIHASIINRFGCSLSVTHQAELAEAHREATSSGEDEPLEAPNIEQTEAKRLRDEYGAWEASGTNPSGLTPAEAGQQAHEDRRLWAARILDVEVHDLAEIDGWLTMATRVARGREHRPGCFCEACRGQKRNLPPPAAA